MGVTSVILNGLTIHADDKYAVGADSLAMLEAMSPFEQVTVAMPGRHPVYVRSQILARPITLVVYFLRVDANDRKTDYDALLSAADPRTGLKALTWSDGITTKRLMVVASSLLAVTWFASASAEMVAPDPDPAII